MKIVRLLYFKVGLEVNLWMEDENMGIEIFIAEERLLELFNNGVCLGRLKKELIRI